MKKIIFFAVALTTLLGCKESLESEDYKLKLLFEKAEAFKKSEIMQDLNNGIYAPPYDFSSIKDLHEYCRKNIWTEDIGLRLAPVIQEEIYSLALDDVDSILSRWTNDIRSPATNQNFSGYAKNIASPTSTGKTIYPKLKKELIESAYYKKSWVWLRENMRASEGLLNAARLPFGDGAKSNYDIFKDQNQETKEAVKYVHLISSCLPADMIMGFHGKPSVTSILLEQTHSDVSKKAFSELGEMLKDFVE